MFNVEIFIISKGYPVDCRKKVGDFLFVHSLCGAAPLLADFHTCVWTSPLQHSHTLNLFLFFNSSLAFDSLFSTSDFNRPRGQEAKYKMPLSSGSALVSLAG